MKVAVCTITFQRPEGLRRLLTALNALTFRADRPELEVIVVDNDPECSARALCDELRSEVRWPLRYDTEPRRGIPFARNKAVACAVDTADFIAFIDDDEVPQPTWLDELLRIQRLYDADVVTGPVVPRFPDNTPRWVVKSGLFATPRRRTGQRLHVAFTNNVLARAEVYRTVHPGFDERMALTGGTDSHFFRRAHRAGFTIVWAAKAGVYDWIPPSRTRFRWLVQRAFRAGNSMTIIHMDMRRSLLTAIVQAVKAGVWMGLGLLVALPGLVWGRHLLVKGVRFSAYGVGMLLGLFGVRYEEYRTTHGV
jgi:GT2 family glycosyltransferase